MKGWTYCLMVLLVMCSSTSSCMCPDKDGDGYVVVSGGCRIPTGKKAGDCKDNAASIHPGAVDIANNMIDEDCDGVELDTLPAAKSPQLSVAPNWVNHIEEIGNYQMKLMI
jgi:hypothetical protein